MRRWLLAGGALAATQMIVYTSVAEALRPGYDASRNWISQLSLGPGGRLAVANLALCGIWLLLAAEGLRPADPGAADPGAERLRADRLVRWCGVCFLLLAVFRTDSGIGYPPGVPTTLTVAGVVHRLVAVVLGSLGIVASVRLGRCLPGRPWARPAGWFVAVVMAVTFTAAGVLVLLDAGGVLPGAPSGLMERIALYLGLAWIGVAGLVLMAGGPSGPGPAAARCGQIPRPRGGKATAPDGR